MLNMVYVKCAVYVEEENNSVFLTVSSVTVVVLVQQLPTINKRVRDTERQREAQRERARKKFKQPPDK